MSFTIYFPDHSEEEDPPLDRLKELLKSLRDSKESDEDQVAVTHDSGWTLEADSDGFLHWINIDDAFDAEESNPEEADDAEIQHWGMIKVPEKKILELFTLLAQGEIDRIKAEPWFLIEGEED